MRRRARLIVSGPAFALVLWFCSSLPATAQRELVEPRTLEQINADVNADAGNYTPPANSTRLTKAPLSEIGRSAIKGGDVPWAVLFTIAGLTAVLATGVSLHRRLKAGPDGLAPRSAFLRYSKRLGLNWRDRLLLWRVARAAKLPTPLALLVASGTLYHHGRQFAAGLSANRRQAVHKHLAAIQRQAFSASASNDSPEVSRHSTGHGENQSPLATS